MQNPHATPRKPKIGYECGRFENEPPPPSGTPPLKGDEPPPPVGTPPWEGGELKEEVCLADTPPWEGGELGGELGMMN